ncbi:MAG: hypothetical protein E7361_00900 [Clostridiales bacterium]|nr:hypothetical protein [Clostridiales bacterium]
MKIKSFKKFMSIILFGLLLMLSVFTFSACNLVVRDKTDYYNQIIATYKYNDKTLEVSMSDLNNTFRTYGYNRYASGYYASLEDCLNDSLKYYMQTTLVFNDIASELQNAYNNDTDKYYHNAIVNVDFVDLENYRWSKTLENIYSSTNPNALEIRYNAFNSMQSAIDKYAEEILKEDDKLGEVEQPSKEPIRAEKEEYTSKLVINEETKEISKRVEDLELFNKDNVATHFVLANNYDEETTAKAFNKYIKLLQQNAKAENRSIEVEDVLRHEEANYIRDAYQAKLLEIHQYYYESTLTITTDNVVDYYKNKYNAQYLNFNYNLDAYRTAMDKYNSEYVFYHANSDNEYILVSHILINFTEEQKAEIKQLQTKLEEDKKAVGLDNVELIEKLDAQYNLDLYSVIYNTKSTYEEDGQEKEAYISDIIARINDYVNGNKITGSIADEDKIIRQKAKNFEDMMYIYNDDPGIMNADFYYAVNVNEGVEDNWEAEFTKGALELYSDYNRGDVLLRPAVSSYGIHIMFYSDMAKNFINHNSIDSITYQTLLNETVNTASDKTIFEYLYDKVEDDNYYTNYFNHTINQLYSESNPKIDDYKFKNLWS